MQRDVGEYGLLKVQALHVTVNVLGYPLTVHFIRNTCTFIKLSNQLIVNRKGGGTTHLEWDVQQGHEVSI